MNQLKTLLTIIMLFAFAIIMINYGKQLEISKYQNSYQTCIKAHNEINGASENACANAQAATHTEFMCGATNQYCWLEVK